MYGYVYLIPDTSYLVHHNSMFFVPFYLLGSIFQETINIHTPE